MHTEAVAQMVELVDTRDLKSLDHCGRTGSSPVPGTEMGTWQRRCVPLLFGVSFLFSYPEQGTEEKHVSQNPLAQQTGRSRASLPADVILKCRDSKRLALLFLQKVFRTNTLLII